MTQLVPDSELVDKLVVANRILYRQGVVDGFGHVSARHDKSLGRFLLARNMAPALVRRDDIITFDLDSAALDPFAERHSFRCYRADAAADLPHERISGRRRGAV